MKNFNSSIYDGDCPIIKALEVIGGKWKLPIIWCLSENGTLRYNQIKLKVHGITNMMLTKCLKDLENNGIVKRRQYNEVPLRVEYSLTQRGADLLPAMKQLYVWGQEQVDLDEDSKK